MSDLASDGQGIDLLAPGTTGWVRVKEWAIEWVLRLAGFSSIVITVGIIVVLLTETVPFFREIPVGRFFGDTLWAPVFDNPRFGIWALIAGTVTTTMVALLVAIPVGTISAVWLSEYCKPGLREFIKPMLELLSAVPTVVYGYFALLFVTPILQWAFGLFGWELSGFNMLSAGLVMGIMIIPYVASLSEDAMRAVPMSLREGAYAMGATRMQTARKVLVPAALSGLTAAYILGIARAVGETMIVAIAAGLRPNFTFNPTEEAATISAAIVQATLGDLPHDSTAYRSIFAAGLVLMGITLVFNIAGYQLRKRYREVY
ncbi:MAG: phosphate ABC transporter permease subunit PstC [Tepidisphaeraceae bacterium]